MILFMLLTGCSGKPKTPQHADSLQIVRDLEHAQGRPIHHFKGPADVLGDTTKNQRSYLKRKE